MAFPSKCSGCEFRQRAVLVIAACAMLADGVGDNLVFGRFFADPVFEFGRVLLDLPISEVRAFVETGGRHVAKVGSGEGHGAAFASVARARLQAFAMAAGRSAVSRSYAVQNRSSASYNSGAAAIRSLSAGFPDCRAAMYSLVLTLRM